MESNAIFGTLASPASLDSISTGAPHTTAAAEDELEELDTLELLDELDAEDELEEEPDEPEALDELDEEAELELLEDDKLDELTALEELDELVGGGVEPPPPPPHAASINENTMDAVEGTRLSLIFSMNMIVKILVMPLLNIGVKANGSILVSI
jgi:hypothetical protein